VLKVSVNYLLMHTQWQRTCIIDDISVLTMELRRLLSITAVNVIRLLLLVMMMNIHEE